MFDRLHDPAIDVGEQAARDGRFPLVNARGHVQPGRPQQPLGKECVGQQGRFGMLAGRFGPRLFMGAGPLVSAAGVLWLLRAGLHTSYLGVVFPSLLVFGLGLSITVAPLTTTVLAEADDSDAGIASAINNAVARVAGLVGIGVVGVVVARTLVGDSFGRSQASVHAFHQAVIACVVCLVIAGTTGAAGIRNPVREVEKVEVAQ